MSECDQLRANLKNKDDLLTRASEIVDRMETANAQLRANLEAKTAQVEAWRKTAAKAFGVIACNCFPEPGPHGCEALEFYTQFDLAQILDSEATASETESAVSKKEDGES